MPDILALTIRPIEGPDTRYRILEYIPYFEKAGITVTHRGLLSSAFYQRQNAGKLNLLDCTRFGWYAVKRLAELMRVRKYDAIWLSREAFPLGPPFLEFVMFKLGVPVILDIDDALFQPDSCNGFLNNYCRSFRKFQYIAPRCAAIVVGSNYLKSYFSRFSGNIAVIPTCVDHLKYLHVVNSPSPDGVVRIGWIGTPTNAGHLEIVHKPLVRLMEKYNVELRLVGLNQAPRWNTDRISLEAWSLAKELDFFSRFDIGIMPLEDTPFSRGKCAFKMIQYMAAGIPVVASPVGANVDALEQGKQGYLADSDDAWETALEKLILDQALRRRMGADGRAWVADHFSFESRWRQYSDLFLEVAKK